MPIINTGPRPSVLRTQDPSQTTVTGGGGATDAQATSNAQGAQATTATSAVGTVQDAGISQTQSDARTGGSGVLRKVKTKLVERTWKELTKERQVTLANVSLGDHGSLGIRLKERIYLARDPMIQDNALRKATTEKLAADSGKNVVWTSTGGLLKSNVGLGESVPTNGVFNTHVGFDLNGLVEYSGLYAHTVDGNGAADVLKNHTVDLPITADNALKMNPGEQVEILGRGSARISAGVGVGHESRHGVINANASAGANIARTVSGDYSVKVTRLDDNKVRVQLSEVESRSRTQGLTANAGLTLNGRDLIDGNLDGTINPSTEPVTLGDVTAPTSSDKGIMDMLKDGLANQLERPVRRYTAFHASVGHSAVEQRKSLTSFVFDLSNPQAKKAYEKLIHLNEDGAAAVANRAGSGVSRHVYTEASNNDSVNANVNFAGKKLLLFKSLKAEREGRLDAGNGVDRLIRTSKYERTYHGIITGEKDIKWEGVRAVNADGTDPSNFFHLKFAKNDKVTTNGELREFVRFAGLLGVEGADVNAITFPQGNVFSRIFSSDDNTKFNADIYFTEAGIKNILSSDENKIRNAVEKAAVTIDPEMQGIKLHDPDSIALAKEYIRLEDKKLNSSFEDERQQLHDEMNQIAGKYQKHRDRSLYKDVAAFRGVEQLVAASQNLGTTGGEAGWAQMFSALGEQKGFDFMPAMAALALLAGPDETLIHQLSLDSHGFTLKSADEGMLRHPDSDITAAIDNHGIS